MRKILNKTFETIPHTDGHVIHLENNDHRLELYQHLLRDCANYERLATFYRALNGDPEFKKHKIILRNRIASYASSANQSSSKIENKFPIIFSDSENNIPDEVMAEMSKDTGRKIPIMMFFFCLPVIFFGVQIACITFLPNRIGGPAGVLIFLAIAVFGFITIITRMYKTAYKDYDRENKARVKKLQFK